MTGRIFLLVFISGLVSILQTYAQSPTIYGVYGHPSPLWEKGYDLKKLGINAIFVRSHSIDSALMMKAKAHNLLVFAEFPTLNGKNYVNTHPEAWVIDNFGEPVESVSWFMGVCPSDSGFLTYRINQLRTLLKRFPVEGVWLDYVHWHAQFEEKEPILPETCFCNTCLSAFENHTGIQLPVGSTVQISQFILSQHEKEWRKWRCKVILDWVKMCKKVINEERPGVLLGLYHCPWTDNEHDGARERILGLDFDLLRKEADVFSPMVYHGRMEKTVYWVAKYINWLSSDLQKGTGDVPLIWPIVQAHNVPAEEFEKALRSGLSGAATGVMMFTSGAVAKDPEKIQIIKKVYTGKN